MSTGKSNSQPAAKKINNGNSRVSKQLSATEAMPTVNAMMAKSLAQGGGIGPELSKLQTGVGVSARSALLEAKVDSLTSALNRAQQEQAAKYIALDHVVPNPWQPRKVFNQEELNTLRDSITAAGRVLQPIAVRKVQLNGEPQYQICAGERRVRASRLAGRLEIPAVILDMTDADMAALALAENIVRADLSDYEIGLAMSQMESQFPSKVAMCETFGINRSQLYRLLSFLKLPSYVRELLDNNVTLLGANLAEDFVSTRGKVVDEAKFDEAAKSALGLLNSKQIEQIDLLPEIAKHLNPALRAPSSSRQKNTLMQGGKKVGTIAEDDNFFSVKIKNTNLSKDQKEQIRGLLGRFFVEV